MKSVLFACVHNAGRSQMAAAWFNALASPDKAKGISAGTEPGTRIHPEVLAAMREVGVDLSHAQPQLLTDELAQTADVLITMGCGEACPTIPGIRRDDWPLEDPGGKPMERVREIREEVRQRVAALVEREGWARRYALVLTKEPTSRSSTHPPKVLFLYGSLRQRSYSRLLAEEGARVMASLGAETRFFDPRELPVCGSVPDTHPKVQELRNLSLWSEAQVWSTPEQHGALTGVMKNQIDWIPLSIGAVRPTQGRTLAVMQVSGGSQSFNAVNALRLLGRWMRMFTIPNQSSVAKAYEQFHDDGTMRDSPYRDRLVDVTEELYKFTMLLRDRSDWLTDRYSERRERDHKAALDPMNPKHRVASGGG